MSSNENGAAIEKLRQVVLDNLENEQFNVQELAEIYGVSRSKLHAIVKKDTGKSASKFIREIRLDEACKMLKDTELTISEIAYRVGFGSPTYFASCFKDAYNCTPGEFKIKSSMTQELGGIQFTGNRTEERESIKPESKSQPLTKRTAIAWAVPVIAILCVFIWWFFQHKENISGRDSEQIKIAVLAFDDMSPDNDHEYLSDGISEEIMNRLASYKDLMVISRTSSFSYKGKNVTIEEIGKELGVAYVLEGSVRKSEDTYRMTVQLIEVKSGLHLWSKTYDNKIEDVLTTQDIIAQNVANRLDITLANKDVLHRKIDPEAYDLYLRANKIMEHFTDSTTNVSDSLIRKSISIDSTYAKSWAFLAKTTFHRTIYYNHITKEEGIKIGEDYAKKAIELDSTYYDGYLWMSNYAWHKKDIPTYEKYFKKGKPLVNNNTSAMDYFMRCAARTNKVKESLEWSEKMIKSSPRDPSGYIEATYDYFYFERYDEAIHCAKKAIDLSTGMDYFYLYGILSELYAHKGEFEKAHEALAKIKNEFLRTYTLSIVKYLEGEEEVAKDHFNTFKSFKEEDLPQFYPYDGHPFWIATIHALYGENDSAFENLARGMEYVEENLEVLFDTYYFKRVYNDSRWEQLLVELEKRFNYSFRAPE